MEPDDDAVLALSKKSQPKKRIRDVPETKATAADGRRNKKSKVGGGHETQRKRTAPPAGVGKFHSRHDEGYSSSASTCFEMDAVDAGHSRSSKARSRYIQPMRIIHMHPDGSVQAGHPFFVDDAFPNEHVHHSASSSENSPMTTSFCSSLSSQDDMNDVLPSYESHSNFREHTNFKYEKPTNDQRPIQVHNVTAISAPHFETVPNTAVASPMRFAHFPQAGGLPEAYPFAQPMERYPARMSTPVMPAFAMPAPVCQPPMAHPIPQHAPPPFLQPFDQRSITPGSDANSVYGGYQPMEFGEPIYHGLPVTHRHNSYPTPDGNGHNMPFAYAEDIPDQNLPAGTLPGTVVRGFTGYASGVGKLRLTSSFAT